MKYFMYSVYDSAAEIYHPPFIQTTDDAAKRALLASLRSDPTSLLRQFPDQFYLFRLAEFDEESGHIIADDEFVAGETPLISVADLIRSAQPSAGAAVGAEPPQAELPGRKPSVEA